MNVLEAMDLLFDVYADKKELCQWQVGFQDEPSDNQVNWVFYGCALASLSGQLEECWSLPELKEAIGHGESLVSCGVLSDEQVQAEIDAAGREFLKWSFLHSAQIMADEEPRFSTLLDK